MADIADNSSTTARISVGDSTTGSLETIGDRDWFRIELTAGQQVRVDLSGHGSTPVEDTYLRILDASGNIIYENDDISAGVERDSSLAFEAPASGTYYIEVGSWNDDYTGGYQLEVSPFTMPPTGDMDLLADQLVSGYWGGSSHHFDVTEGDTLTVNLTELTSAGQDLARAALALWTDIIGVTFREVSSGGQITFDDTEPGAFAEASWSGEITSSAHVNVSADWLAEYGTDLNGYAFQTYIHEIGHALGLGHAGNYNGDGQYPFDVTYEVDGWPASVMSYFDQQESSYWASQDFTQNFIVTPMMADILAMSVLYGLSTTTRAGDTVYGPDSWHADMGALCIFDSAGNDTIDVSSLAGNHLINLNPGTFSNVLGEVGNVSIAFGVVIENAIGSSANDVLIGNNAGNLLDGKSGDDQLGGGAGDDRLYGNGGNDELIGGSGVDRMYGGSGNDRYIVGDSTDYAYEYDGGGEDTVEASLSHTLRASIEHLTLTGSANIHGRGNELANSITGNSGSNRLYGQEGDDRLYGGAGNDRLDAGVGLDRLYGGAGNDTYLVSDATDFAYENPGEGIDFVYASVSHGLRANVERLYLTGTANLTGTGNEIANIISGNSGANRLYGREGDDRLYGREGNDRIDGGAGIDRMYGGTGNDTYYVTDSTDYAYENAGEGTDFVYAWVDHTLRTNVERLYLKGSASIDGAGNDLANILSGNAGSNSLRGLGGNDKIYAREGSDIVDGGDGNDWLEGGSGRDRYDGGSGADRFVFRDGDFGGATATTADVIHDFGDAEDDRMHLGAVDANSRLDGDQAFEFLGTGAFTGTAGELRYEQIEGNTYVQGDTNGDGTADFWIRLDGLHTLASDDFLF